MDGSLVQGIDVESLLLILRIEEENAQALFQAAEFDAQEAAPLLSADPDAQKGVIAEHEVLPEEALAPLEEREAETPMPTETKSSSAEENNAEPEEAEPLHTGPEPAHPDVLEQDLTDTTINEAQEEEDDAASITHYDDLNASGSSSESDYDAEDSGDGQPNQQEASSSKTKKRSRRRKKGPRLDCISCSTNTRWAKTIEFPCQHSYCFGCVRSLHQAATTDESLFPPRCCGKAIPFDLVRPIMSAKAAQAFEEKAVEFRTNDKTYCSEATCSHFIPPENIDGEVARCGKCKTKTCQLCKKKLHEGPCADDNDAPEVMKLAAELGWQRCKNCKRIVELSIGCNHMSQSPRPQHKH